MICVKNIGDLKTNIEGPRERAIRGVLPWPQCLHILRTRDKWWGEKHGAAWGHGKPWLGMWSISLGHERSTHWFYSKCDLNWRAF